ncbi:pyridoxamine 5'-phosphate oxidase family protein [Marinoscillum furvescens]|uniref:Nitroimidazol reductase NimA-like FMN-containing flavoprotein (Pyridoxamine 5'-phosphate oxidase superfamily) n=1 Tax=Marinoscillum furvescens DSM 4134 TaxID=1122208 RepID=A0A3D9L1B6_MARFU|nr:pyridoxamine 5'-phosphate oxidase family protein [Marinoscillum furvescens]RED97532.1 hypothetical protein C7460_112143 [Marinoscillum furvescens DSM 4134]
MKTNLKPSRYPGRVCSEAREIYEILDEGRFCTIAYAVNEEPHQLPTGYCRLHDKVYIHGSSKSHFLHQLADVRQVCFNVMLFDGLVLAPTAFDHSVNYRSVIAYSPAKKVESMAKKREVLECFTNKYIPGRMKDLAAPSDQQLSATLVLEISLEYVSAKVRSGTVGGDLSDAEVWSGVVPAAIAYGVPEQDSSQSSTIPVPGYLTEMVVKSNSQC